MEWTIGGVIGGVLVGTVIGVVSEPLLKALAGATRPLTKEIVKGGLIVVASASQFMEGAQQEWSAMVNEVQEELKASAAKY